MTEESADYPDLDINAIMGILPHRYPMLLVDRITNIHQNGGTGVKAVTINEPFFQGHFPKMPVMPGVLIIEALAQAAACVAAHIDEVDTDNQVVLFMGVDKARFRKPVLPGDVMHLEVEIAQRRPPVWKFQGKAVVNGKTVAEASYSAMLAPVGG